MFLLLAACADPTAEKTDPADTSAAVDTADSGDDTDTGDTGDTADTGDTGETGETADTAETAETGDPTDTAAQARAANCDALTTAANDLLAALTPEQQDAITFDLYDPSRNDWSNLPVPSVPRDGVAIGDMDPGAQTAAWALLQASLSDEGFTQASQIVQIDDYDTADPLLGSEYYTWVIYGTPSTKEKWAWQFDGHHLVYNFTVTCPDVVMAPNLLGADPEIVLDGPMAGYDPLGVAREGAFALLASLDPVQHDVAVLGTEDFGKLLAGPEVDWTFPAPAGMPARDMTEEQRALVLDALRPWVEAQEPDYAALRMVEIEAELDDITFAWIGGESFESLYYFRIQGPTVYVEWDCNGWFAHIHAVYRNPVEDYGGDVLAMHYTREPHAWAPPR